LLVLGGGSNERAIRAAELFRSGAAPRIIVSGSGDGEQNKRLLVSKGVPPAAIELEGKSRSTKENAQFSIPLLRAMGAEGRGRTTEMLKSEGQGTEDGGLGQATPHPTLSPAGAERAVQRTRPAGVRRVIIVTSWYHSRRALACFEHYAPDITFYSRPSYFAYPRVEWRLKGIGGPIKSEYVKLLGYWVCYGVCPL
jgi:uncharacterized SAM-binding protein YcdF (DUF218 family)